MEELIKALRICSSQPFCDNCPRYDMDRAQETNDCCGHLLTDVADAIERLKRQNEKLQAENATYRKLILLSAGEINELRYKLHLDEMDIEEIKLP